MKKIIQSKYTPYILLILLTAVISAPIFTMNLFLNNEATLHMSRFLAVDGILKDGVFPPIISYKYMEGFGYALNLFYGPLTTFIPIIFLNLFGTAGMAFKTFSILTVILSGITMYKFMLSVTNRKSMSIIAALIYISAPYKLSDIYSRNAIGEYTAFIFIPIVFEGLHNLINGDKKKHYLLIIGVVGLVLSHTITTIYIALFTIIYLLLNIKKLKDIDIWKKAIIDIIISFLICAFYVFPLLEHTLGGEYVLYSQEKMLTTGENVYSTTLGFKELFANEAGEQEIRFSIGIVTIVLTVLTIFCVKKIKKKHDKIYSDFLILAIISLFMCTKLFPWTIMPSVLTVIQFAWRNLGFFAFFISLVCGINAVVFAEDVIKKSLWKETFLFGIVVSIFVFAFLGVFRDWRFDNISEEANLDKMVKERETMGTFQINREYMPLKAQKDINYILERENKTYVLNGETEIVSEQKEKLEDTIILKNVQNDTILELPYLYYLGYEATATYGDTTEKLEITESENGFLSVKLKESENVSINVQYTGTILEKAGYIVSILGIIIFILYRLKEGKFNERREEVKKLHE